MRLDDISKEWVAKNPWFHANQTLNEMMIECHHAVVRKYPTLALEETYDHAKVLLIDRLEHYIKVIKGEVPEGPTG
jgi:hypothetical protein